MNHRLNWRQISPSCFRTLLPQTYSCMMESSEVTLGEGGWKAKERAKRQAAMECALCVWEGGGMRVGRGDFFATTVTKCLSACAWLRPCCTMSGPAETYANPLRHYNPRVLRIV